MHRTIAAPLLLLTVLVGCEWEAKVVSSESPLDHVTCEDGGSSFEGTGLPPCGGAFETEIWGECNSCDDRGCTRAEEGVYECRCYDADEHCWDNTTDAGVFESESCLPVGAQCDCGDGKGRIYECSCENPNYGSNGPHECGCSPASDEIFDYEFECEQDIPGSGLTR